MISNQHKYYSCRGSVVFNQQLDMFELDENYENSPAYRLKIFKKSFSVIEEKFRKTKYYKKEYIYYFRKLGTDFISLEIGFEKPYEKPTKEQDSFATHQDKMYPNIKVFINCRDQMIYIQENADFSTMNASINIVQSIINILLIDKPYKIFVELVTSSFDFWNLIENSEKDIVVTLGFELLAPNFLGANDSASDLIKELHRNQNVEKMDLNLSSDTGIKVDKNQFSSLVDYTSQGSGSWWIRLKNKFGKKARVIKKSDNPQKVNIEVKKDHNEVDLVIKSDEEE